jgi:hypothetical protein
MTMLGLAVIELVSHPGALDADLWLRLGTLVLALAFVPVDASPQSVLVVFAAALIAQVVYELARHEAHAGAAEI